MVTTVLPVHQAASGMRIDSSGRVGIGTSDFAGTSVYADNLVVKDATDAGITNQGANSTSEYASLYLAEHYY